MRRATYFRNFPRGREGAKFVPILDDPPPKNCFFQVEALSKPLIDDGQYRGAFQGGGPYLYVDSLNRGVSQWWSQNRHEFSYNSLVCVQSSCLDYVHVPALCGKINSLDPKPTGILCSWHTDLGEIWGCVTIYRRWERVCLCLIFFNGIYTALTS